MRWGYSSAGVGKSSAWVESYTGVGKKKILPGMSLMHILSITYFVVPASAQYMLNVSSSYTAYAERISQLLQHKFNK